MADHKCKQERRLNRIEAEAAALEQKHRERDDTVRDALLELGKEISSLGTNVAEQLVELRERTGRQVRGLHAKIAELAAELDAE